MYISFYIFMPLLYIHQNHGQECEFTRIDGTNLTDQEIKFGIALLNILDSAEPGTVLFELKTKDVIKIVATTSNPSSDGSYMNATLTPDGIFNLILTDHFRHYEELETNEVMSFTVEFLCRIGITKSIDMYQPITDTNNHYPEFVNTPYRYNLSMPYPKDIPIDVFGTIAARDIDLTNSRISFFLEESDPINQGLNAYWLSSDSKDRKLHYARLITTAALNYETGVTFHLFASDSGTPPNISNTTITILIDKPNSIPRFTEPIYIADYTNLRPENANGTIFIFDQGGVTLSGGIDKTVNYSFKEDSGEYQNNFALDVSLDYSSVRLILIDPPDKFFNESFVLLTLTAKKSGAEVTTVLHISLPGRSTSRTTTTPEITIPTSSISTRPTTTENPQYNDNSCISNNSNIPIIVVSVLLVGMTFGLVASIIVIWRRSRAIPKISKNRTSRQEERKEMAEIHRDSNGTTPVVCTQRSVAFNDTVEEIYTVRL